MKILSITTSSPICGVAILDNSTLIKEINLNSGLTHSETLMPAVKKLFDETNLTLNDIDLLVVDIGPGSFTGIRIGVSSIKAFAEASNIQSIGVNALEGLAYNVTEPSIICSLIDARKENVYVEIFEYIEGNYIIRREASFENIEQLLLEIKKIKPEYNLTFVGDGSDIYKNKILDALPNSNFAENNNISAKNIGYAGLNHYINKDFSSIEPLYLRKSQAEQKMEESSNASN